MTPMRGRGSWGPDPDGLEPSAEDLAGAAGVPGGMGARRHLDRSDRLTLAGLVDRQTDLFRGWGNPAGVWRDAASGAIHSTSVQWPGTATLVILSGPTRILVDDRGRSRPGPIKRTARARACRS